MNNLAPSFPFKVGPVKEKAVTLIPSSARLLSASKKMYEKSILSF